MRRAQAQLRTRDSRVPLPAEHALRAITDALAKLPEWRLRLSERALAEQLRRRFATALAFVFMGRQDSAVHLAASDFGIDSDFIWLRLTEKMKRGQALRRIIRLPLGASPAGGVPSALPQLAALGRAYLLAREALGDSQAMLFQLPREPKPVTRHMEAWVSVTFDEVGAVAPPGFVYLGHSLRSGGSSAAEAIRVPR